MPITPSDKPTQLDPAVTAASKADIAAHMEQVDALIQSLRETDTEYVLAVLSDTQEINSEQSAGGMLISNHIRAPALVRVIWAFIQEMPPSVQLRVLAEVMRLCMDPENGQLEVTAVIDLNEDPDARAKLKGSEESWEEEFDDLFP